jgi:hypothetical protein
VESVRPQVGHRHGDGHGPGPTSLSLSQSLTMSRLGRSGIYHVFPTGSGPVDMMYGLQT